LSKIDRVGGAGDTAGPGVSLGPTAAAVGKAHDDGDGTGRSLRGAVSKRKVTKREKAGRYFVYGDTPTRCSSFKFDYGLSPSHKDNADDDKGEDDEGALEGRERGLCVGSEELGLREFRPIEEASSSSSTPTRKRKGRIDERDHVTYGMPIPGPSCGKGTANRSK
jgi:hypothetical protein